MPEGNPSLFIKREYCTYKGFEDDYTDTFQSEAPEYKDSKLLIDHYNHGLDVRAIWQHDSNATYKIEDTLCDSGDEMQRGGNKHTDDLADGYADKRFIGYVDEKTDWTGVLMADDDLNGTFESGYNKKNGLSSFIKEMFGK